MSPDGWYGNYYLEPSRVPSPITDEERPIMHVIKQIRYMHQNHRGRVQLLTFKPDDLGVPPFPSGRRYEMINYLSPLHELIPKTILTPHTSPLLTTVPIIIPNGVSALTATQSVGISHGLAEPPMASHIWRGATEVYSA
jgi:hypothetical protein